MNIEVRNLCFSYGQSAVLKNVSFTARKGELLSVLGPNGVGKSTLFRCILGLLKGCKGEIIVGSTDVKRMAAKELAHRIAYIPQSHHPAFNYSVMDVVLMGTAHQVGAISSPGKREMAQARAALEQMGISSMAQKSYLKLSGGEQQLVLISRALAQQAKAILMDEPTSNLDFGNQLRVLQEVRRLAAMGYTILMSSHNPQHILHFSDRVIALCDGEVIAGGPPHDVMDEALLKRIYGVDVRFIDTDEGRTISPVLMEGNGR